MSKPVKSEGKKTEIRVKYDVSSAAYASQALVQAGAEEVFLDFSSSIVTDASGARVMPIHTRIAMSHAAARRLLTALGQTMQRHGVAAESTPRS